MKVVAFATIKMNSERVPHKNIQPIGSKPLCYHILDTALQIEEIDNVYVYCSDQAITNYIPAKCEFLQREKWLDGNEIRARDTYTAFINDIDADVYVMDNPTQGIDVGAKFSIYNLINSISAEGKGILVFTNEYPEMVQVADRVIVMYKGKIVCGVSAPPAEFDKTQDIFLGSCDCDFGHWKNLKKIL